MRWRLDRVSRRPPWPGWAVVVVAAWLSLGAAAVRLSAAAGRHVELCLFKRLTGIPCPGCGFTRGVLALVAGRPWETWLFNPLLFTLLGFWAAAVVLRVCLARAVRVELPRGQRRIAWAGLFLLLAANWAYLIVRVG